MKTDTKIKKKIYKPYNAKTVVSVNNQILKLQPGDSILLNSNDTYVKTVSEVLIGIDGKVTYHLKWFDNTNMRDAWMNENEISAMALVPDDEKDDKHESKHIGFN